MSGGSLSRLAWKRLLKNSLAVVSMIMIGTALMISILGYLITPDSTPFCNQQYLELATQKPGFSVRGLCVEKNAVTERTSCIERMVHGAKHSYACIPFGGFSFENDQIILSEFSEDRVSDPITIAYNLADVVYALKPGEKITMQNDTLIFTDIKDHHQKKSVSDLQETILNERMVTKHYWLGTDQFGRDLLSRLLIGTRVSLAVGFISVAISLVVGILLGSVAGFFRKRTDDIIMWFIQVVWSIPTLLLVIAITFALGKGFWQIFVAVGLTMWVEVARVVRGQIISIREKEYVEAGKALGYGNARIIFRHILPNALAPVIVISAANFASAILIEAGLSFLGIGVQPPMPSWGSMIRENYPYLILDAAYLAILPGLAIMIMVLAFMLIGNALRDALDVRIAGR